MENLNKNQKIILTIILILMLVFIGYYIIKKTSNSEYISLEINENENTENNIIDEKIEEKDIIIHIAGAVQKQGIVKIKEGSRISDVIESAGGITEDADLSKINLAYSVKDGQKIYVPSVNDKENINTITEDLGENIIDNDNINKTSKVNINTASQTELETLNGIGPSTALKIINYRSENGNFKKIDDIKNVPGIGDSKFENIKNDICI